MMNWKMLNPGSTSILLICQLIILMLISPNMLAQWSNDPTINTPICTAAGGQENPAIVDDGEGGAFITWEDTRDYSNSRIDIYAQHIDSSGFVMWTIDGAEICTADDFQSNPVIMNDGYGGAIIVWYDTRNYDNKICAQRISSSGTTKWTANGAIIGLGGSGIKIINDGFGGFILTWFDNRSGNDDIYAQRIDSSGTVQWTADGVPICTAVDNQRSEDIVPDGEGGAIIAWQDARSGFEDIYAQRIDSTGNVQWTVDGRLICAATGRQYAPITISDNTNGAIVVWTDERSGMFQNDLYAQRVSSTGTNMWTTNGVPISTESGSQWQHCVVSDGSGDAIIAWKDERSGDGVYAQRVDNNGIPQWQTNGIDVCTANWTREEVTICGDGNGGAVIAWKDDRDYDNDIYAQRLDASGVAQWQADGIPICTAAGYQRRPRITGIDSKGAILAWVDERNGFSNSDIYAQWVNAQGQLTSIEKINSQRIPKEFMLGQNYPNPFNPTTVIEYTIPQPENVEIAIYDMLGQRIKTLVSGMHAAGTYEVIWDATNDLGSKVSSGIYLFKITSGKYIAIKKMVLLR
jgi:hypothetical protein